MDTVARSEMVEKEIDAMISRRDEHRRQTEGERLTEALWMPSARAYAARLGDQRRQERLEFHEGQARRLSVTLGALVRYHEREAERYRTPEGAA